MSLVKSLVIVAATTAALGSAAYANDPGYPGTIERGRAGVVMAPGVPVGDLFVCDATAKPPKPGRKPRTCKF